MTRDRTGSTRRSTGGRATSANTGSTPSPGHRRRPSIDGRLGAGDAATGWLVFVVPEDADQVWLDFVDYDGSVIFTVQIDGVPAVPPPLPTDSPVLPVI